jgi:hypothetical protein
MVTKAELFAHTENKIDNQVRVDKQIICKENKSTYCYINQSEKHVAKIRVDGGLIRDKSVKKCDWLLINWDLAHSVFVELKGSDIKTAVEQIKSTISVLWSDIKTMGINIAHVRIVVTRVAVPNLVVQKKRELKVLLKQCGKGTVEIQSQKLEELF